MSENAGVTVIYGSVEPRTFHKFENGRMVTYSYAIHRDRLGIETHRTAASPLCSVGWGNGKPFTEDDYRRLIQA